MKLLNIKYGQENNIRLQSYQSRTQNKIIVQRVTPIYVTTLLF